MPCKMFLSLAEQGIAFMKRIRKQSKSDQEMSIENYRISPYKILQYIILKLEEIFDLNVTNLLKIKNYY